MPYSSNFLWLRITPKNVPNFGRLSSLRFRILKRKIRPMTAVLRSSMAQLTFVIVILGAAAAVTLALGAIGLYGVMAFVVTRRTKEMGVRMALGAHPGSVIWLVMKEVLILLSIGLLIGVPSAFALGQLVSTQLYGIKASDPLIAGVTAAILIVVAALAGLIPARRASRIDPIIALRYE